jgi:hypothetical protein
MAYFVTIALAMFVAWEKSLDAPTRKRNHKEKKFYLYRIRFSTAVVYKSHAKTDQLNLSVI